MPKVIQGQTAYGIVRSLGVTPEEFLKSNPGFAGVGGKNDYMGLTGNIQIGQDYTIPTKQPVQGTPSYIQDTANVNSGGNTNTSTIVGTSDATRAKERADAIQKLKDEATAGLAAPTLYRSVDEFNKMRQEKGVVQDEGELASIQNESAQIKEKLRELGASAGFGTSEEGRTGIMSENERNAQFSLDSLAIRENAVINRLNTKNAYIKTVLDLGEQDYNDAYKEYNDNYNKNIKAIDMYNSTLNDQQKDALTGFTTTVNLLKDKNVDVNTLNPIMKAQMDSLALQAGLPVGIFETMLTADSEKLMTPITVDNASGGKDVYFLSQGADGIPHIVSQFNLKGNGGGGGDLPFKSGSTSFSGQTIAAAQKKLDASRGSDNYANSGIYLDMLAAWKKDGGLEQDFFSKFPAKNYLNPSDTSIPQYIRDMLKKAVDETLY